MKVMTFPMQYAPLPNMAYVRGTLIKDEGWGGAGGNRSVCGQASRQHRPRTPPPPTHTHTNTHTHTHTHTHIYTLTHTCTHTYIYTLTHTPLLLLYTHNSLILSLSLSLDRS